jgi:amino acid transporter
MISRSLGPEFGGSIGLCFYLSTVMNGVLNVLAFVEPLLVALGGSTAPAEYQFLLGTLVLVVCTIIPLLGTRAYARTEAVLSAVLLVASASVFVSFVLRTPFVDGEHGIAYTGLDSDTLHDNLYPKFGADESFRSVFSIVFSACNGILAGAAMSGDLSEPSRAIPKGTMWGLLLTFGMHLVATVLLGATTVRDGLYSDLAVMEHIALAPWLVGAGVYATAAFGAISSVSGASRILQAIARDGLLPVLKPFAQGTPTWDEPTAAVILTYALMQAALFTGDFNRIALVVAIFSLLTFGGLNLACLLLRLSAAPNFRPAFPYFNVWTALSGTVACFAFMFAVDVVYALVALVFLATLIAVIHFVSPPKTWGDIAQSLLYHQVRKFLLLLDITRQHPKYWRPNILLIVNDPLVHFQLIHFCNALKKGGLYMLGHVLQGSFEERIGDYTRQQAAWATLVKDMHIKAFVHLAMAPRGLDGARQLLTSSGLGGLVPNIVVLPLLAAQQTMARAPQFNEHLHEQHLNMGLHTLASAVDTLDIPAEAPLTAVEFVQLIQDALYVDKAVVVAHGFSNLDVRTYYHMDEPVGFVDVWPLQLAADMPGQDEFSSYTLVLQLGCILHTVKAWRRHYRLRVMCFVEYAEDVAEEHRRLARLLAELRIQAEIHVWCLEDAEVPVYEAARSLSRRATGTTLGAFALSHARTHSEYGTIADVPSLYNRLSTNKQYEIINCMFRKHSAGATILLTTLAPPTHTTPKYCDEYVERLRRLTHGMPPMMMMHTKTMTVTAEL